MAPSRHRGRNTLSQGLDKEVYQVIRKIIDEHAQYEDEKLHLTFAKVYDVIRSSNSSLNRRPKKLLEDSIERVIDSIRAEASSDSDEIGDFAQLGEESTQIPVNTSNGLNKSIIGAWSTAPTPTARPPKRDQEQDKTTQMADPEPVQKRRLVTGEPLQKKRKPTSAIDRSPPTHVSLQDMGGIDSVIEQFEDLLVLPMLQPEAYSSSKVQPPRGILIHGPPGCGKTMVANAVAAALGVSFISISAPSVVSGMSGESEKALREHFEEAKKAAPCLLFIDEIDAITPKRESAQREMEKRIVAQLLTCMDDLDLEKTDGKPVVVLAATNRPDSLDAALRRGGRFDKEINMSVPSEPVREQILRALTRNSSLADDIDFALLAKRTPGFVGADLNDLVSTAGAAAIKRYATTLKANAARESTSMDVDMSGSSSTNPPSSTLTSFLRLINYAKTHPSPNFSQQEQQSNGPESGSTTSTTVPPPPAILITQTDFLLSLPKIQPSALREGFATIPSTTFASIGALTTHIGELQRTMISPIQDPTLYRSMGLTASSGTLLWGPPGCGKTLLAKAVANASHANFISVKGPELLNKYVGESERAVRQLFTRARSSTPVIIFFDELDALVPRRDGSLSEAGARVVNTLLTELDGVGHSREGIYVMAATNRPDIVDPAMLRPGRLERLLYVGLPEPEERVDILRTLCARLRDFVWSEQVAEVARGCDGFSGADLMSLMTEAGYAAIARYSAARSSQSGVETSSALGHVTMDLSDFIAARKEIRPSVSAEEIRKFEKLRREWGKTA